MHNSTIITKKKNLACGHYDYAFSKNRCKRCATIDSTKKRIALQKDKPKIKELQLSEDNQELAKAVVANNQEMKKWFDMVATYIKAKPYCENCGEWIPDKFYRHASAHILPKSIFPSVKTHPLNFLILGAGCGCHKRYDDSIEKAVRMNIWTKATERFRTFEHLITEKHKFLDLFRDHQWL